ncbi:MAG: 23S rRNA (guanosine(2251)-2'-O)-methyltransferase RlmB [Thermodesulfovibrio sp.]|nr:23S rRNA (guanosine(2251)-2'-O)-methyltransferase RlmB [Thermodesulfovibrio sp.]
MESKDRVIFIYGINPILEAFKVKDAVKEIYISRRRQSKLTDILELSKRYGVSVKIVDNEFFKRFDYESHQGVIAKVKPKKTLTIQEALKIPEDRNETAFYIVVDLVEDPQNFGAILRVADSVGAHAVVYQERHSVGLTPSVWKASAGAVWHINLVQINNIKYAIKYLKEKDIKIIGAEADSKHSFWDVDFTQPIALVVGSEAKGIRATVKALCDRIVKIPMKGKLNSLNVSVATAVLAYEVLRQRTFNTL